MSRRISPPYPFVFIRRPHETPFDAPKAGFHEGSGLTRLRRLNLRATNATDLSAIAGLMASSMLPGQPDVSD